MERSALPPDAPSVEEVLTGLAQNDTGLLNFSASGSFTLLSPDRPGIDRFRHSKILFRQPADLHVLGRGPMLTTVFRLTCVGSEFLVEFPTERQYYYQVEGEKFESVPFSVSPSDVAREMFLPEDWSHLKKGLVHMTAYDTSTQTASLAIMERGFPRSWVRRRIDVSGLPWVVMKSERFDKQGNTMATVTKDGYQEKDGVRFATKIEADFPGEKTRMTFDMQSIKINTELDDPTFNIDAIRTRLEKLGHEKLEERPQ